MRRWIVFFFVVLLPLQFAWSAASAYCQHETVVAQAVHLGHHEHQHQAQDQDGSSDSSGSGFASDPDCGACHAAGTPLLGAMFNGFAFAVPPVALTSAVTPPFTSALARAPDRPQWRRLV